MAKDTEKLEYGSGDDQYKIEKGILDRINIFSSKTRDSIIRVCKDIYDGKTNSSVTKMKNAAEALREKIADYLDMKLKSEAKLGKDEKVTAETLRKYADDHKNPKQGIEKLLVEGYYKEKLLKPESDLMTTGVNLATFKIYDDKKPGFPSGTILKAAAYIIAFSFIRNTLEIGSDNADNLTKLVGIINDAEPKKQVNAKDLYDYIFKPSKGLLSNIRPKLVTIINGFNAKSSADLLGKVKDLSILDKLGIPKTLKDQYKTKNDIKLEFSTLVTA